MYTARQIFKVPCIALLSWPECHAQPCESALSHLCDEPEEQQATIQ